MTTKKVNRFKGKNLQWTFAKVREDIEMCKLPPLPSIGDLYKDALNTREAKHEMYQTALNAALENLFSWERAARADGFGVEAVLDMHNGAPHTVFSEDGQHVTFVQAYGVIVKDLEKGGS